MKHITCVRVCSSDHPVTQAALLSVLRGGRGQSMDRTRSRSPHREEGPVEEQRNWALQGYLQNELKIAASEDVIKETVRMLTDN